MSKHQQRVYIASKLRHAELFRELRNKVAGIYFTARWPITAMLSSEASKPAAHWQQDNFDDIARSDFVLGYVEEGEHLKGGLVEIGYALAHGKPVILIGTHEDYSKWQFHPLCYRAGTIALALDMITHWGQGERSHKASYSGTASADEAKS